MEVFYKYFSFFYSHTVETVSWLCAEYFAETPFTFEYLMEDEKSAQILQQHKHEFAMALKLQTKPIFQTNRTM